VLICVLSATSCSETEVSSDASEILVSWPEAMGYPDVLDLGQVDTGASSTAEVTISSVGHSPLFVEDVWMEEDTAELLEDGVAGALPPGQVQEVTVRFTPLQPGTVSNRLLVGNSATNEPIPVPISAIGQGDPIPDVFAEPTFIDFEEVALFEEVKLELVIGNAGFAPLELTGIELKDDSGVFSLDDEPLLSEPIGPSASWTVEVSFRPTSVLQYRGMLEILSSDPDEETLSVELLGSGVFATGDGPVAICRAEPAVVAPPFESVVWVGHDSYDTSGVSITSHEWTLTSRPQASAVDLSPCDSTPNCGPYTPDVAGTYTAELSVSSADGQSDSCTAALQAVPTPTLWIELSWTLPHDDLDLHLVAPGGSAWSDTDCYYATCLWSSPDWGEPGFTDDDPSMVATDISGIGPEIVEIAAPAEGAYTVFVHDDSGADPGHGSDPEASNLATVSVYVDGSLEYQNSVEMEGEGDERNICVIEFPDGSVTPW